MSARKKQDALSPREQTETQGLPFTHTHNHAHLISCLASFSSLVFFFFNFHLLCLFSAHLCFGYVHVWNVPDCSFPTWCHEKYPLASLSVWSETFILPPVRSDRHAARVSICLLNARILSEQNSYLKKNNGGFHQCMDIDSPGIKNTGQTKPHPLRSDPTHQHYCQLNNIFERDELRFGNAIAVALFKKS